MSHKENLIKTILIAIGEDCKREGLVETPQRVVRMWNDIFKGYDIKNLPVITTFNNGNDGIIYDEMICDTGDFYSHCEHHMIPFFGKYYFAYVPHAKGKILGISKVARVVDFYSSKLQVQERLTHEIVDCLWKRLSINTKFPPLGMALVIEASHLCKEMRGVKKKGKMRTTKIIGIMKTDSAARAEFFNWVNGRN